MHLADILVLGPFPLVGRSIRLRLGAALVGLLALLLAATAALAVANEPVAVPIRNLALRTLGRQAAPTPVATGTSTHLQSTPAGAEILLDGQVAGETPAEITVDGHTVALRRADAPEVRLLDPGSGTVVPVWAKASVFAVRPPVPGSAITDLTLLGDGRLALSVASPGGPSDRQAWMMDPVRAHQERVGSPIHVDNPPAGVVVAPDGQHNVALWRGATATTSAPAMADQLVLDGPHGERPLLADDILGNNERVTDLTWAPDSQSALLVTQRTVRSNAASVSLTRLRQVALEGPPRDLVDLPMSPIEGSWMWAPDGHAVAFLVRTTPPTLATLDVTNGAVRSVADVAAGLLPAEGAVAPATWTIDGTLLFTASSPPDVLPSAPTPAATPSTPQSTLIARVQALAPDRTDAHPLAAGATALAGPAVGPDGTSLLALGQAPDGTLLIRTLDPTGHAVSEQSLGTRAAGVLSVRWDLRHGQLVLLQAAPAGGIAARVLRIDDPASAVGR